MQILSELYYEVYSHRFGNDGTQINSCLRSGHRGGGVSAPAGVTASGTTNGTTATTNADGTTATTNANGTTTNANGTTNTTTGKVDGNAAADTTDTTVAKSDTSTKKMSMDECTKMMHGVHAGSDTNFSDAEAKPYLGKMSSMKLSTKMIGKLSSDEFMTACENGTFQSMN